MPSLKAIRKRIASVKNTQKITKAMKLVAAARLRRAQDQIVAARPYARALEEVIGEVAARAGKDAHPLLEQRPPRRVELVVITSDRGLAGAYNTNVNRAAERFVIEHRDDMPETGLVVVGRKGREVLRRRKVKINQELAGVNSTTALERARELTHDITRRYVEGTLDAVYLVYNEFKSAISPRVTVEPLLPVVPMKLDEAHGLNDFKYEPSREELLGHIVPLHIEVQIYRALLESVAGFFGAQMSAMDSATNNATDMIGRLTLEFNRARQAAITKELMEIVGGAEALKG